MVDPQGADPTRRRAVIVSLSDWDQLGDDEQDGIAGEVVKALRFGDSQEEEEEEEE